MNATTDDAPETTSAGVPNSGAAARQVAAWKRGQVVRWLLRWELSDVHVLGDLLQLSRSGTYATLSGMVRAGYIARAPINGCPTPVYHLRQAGLSAAQQLLLDDGYSDDAKLSAAVYPSRLNTAHVQHDLLVQRYVLQWQQRERARSEDRGERCAWLSSRQLDHRSFLLGLDEATRRGGKLPDAVLIYTGETGKQRRVALELQQTAEPDAVIERKLAQYVRAITANEVQGLVYASTRRHVLENIQRVAREVRKWWYNPDQRQWYPHEGVGRPLLDQVPANSITWRELEGLDATYYQYALL